MLQFCHHQFGAGVIFRQMAPMAFPRMQRLLTAELLDHLDPDDPRALRSRSDLRMLDALLGNSRWIVRSLRLQHSGQIIELGAGEGRLCRRLAQALPARVFGLDRMPAPATMPESARWVQGDFMQTLENRGGDTCCGSLILHHLNERELGQLGCLLGKFRRLVFSEPYRSRWPLLMASVATPLVGEVTRHDMPASIKAGFRRGELASLLGLDPTDWEIHESVTPWGALRFDALRVGTLRR